MTPIESMACGVPVIWVDEGWLLETVVHTQTGKLIHIADADEGVHTLQEVVQNTTDIEWQSMKWACISRAKDFSLDTFTTELKRYIL
jgi:glycosyltransferase involved in cell wall biosynthesis